MLSIIDEVAALGWWPSVEVRGREERREVEDCRGNMQLFQALEKGPWIWGAREDSHKYPVEMGLRVPVGLLPEGGRDISRNCLRLQRQNWRPLKFETRCRCRTDQWTPHVSVSGIPL